MSLTKQMIKDVVCVTMFKHNGAWIATFQIQDGREVQCLNANTLPEAIELVAAEMGMHKKD